MNPHQKNKVDIGSLSADEQRLFRMYGKLPNSKDLLQNKLKERKYFDSGDYALSKAGKTSDSGVTSVGTEHPMASKIPHVSPLVQQVITPGIEGYVPVSNPFNSYPPKPLLPPPAAGLHRGSINGIPGGGLPGATSRSPVRESSFLARTANVDEQESDSGMGEGDEKENKLKQGSISLPPKNEGIPIRS